MNTKIGFQIVEEKEKNKKKTGKNKETKEIKEISRKISKAGKEVAEWMEKTAAWELHGNQVCFDRPIRNSAMARWVWVRSSHTMQIAILENTAQRPCSACIRAAQPYAFWNEQTKANHGPAALQTGCGPWGLEIGGEGW